MLLYMHINIYILMVLCHLHVVYGLNLDMFSSNSRTLIICYRFNFEVITIIQINRQFSKESHLRTKYAVFCTFA